MLRYKALLLFFFLSWQPLSAAPLQHEIPEALAPWIPWVMEGQESRHCPHPWNQSTPHHCLWPSSLKLSVDHQQGHFEQHWQVLADGWVSLRHPQARLWVAQARRRGGYGRLLVY